MRKEDRAECSEPTGPPTQSATPGQAPDAYTDDRRPFDWKSKYDQQAQNGIKLEAKILIGYLTAALLLAAFFVSLDNQQITIPLSLEQLISGQKLALTINFNIFAEFFVGWVGGTTFSLKWLVHACAKGKWHLDRRPWRLIVPLLGGVYALVVLTLLGTGMFGDKAAASGPFAVLAALAFLVGYFSDGVSGLLSNIANAVFGTLEKK